MTKKLPAKSSEQSGSKKQEVDSLVDQACNRLAFRGNFTNSIDVKGRVSLPADFRRVLSTNDQQSIVLTNYISDGARCLEGFAVDTWATFEANLRSKSRFSAKLQKLENFYLSRAAECKIDSVGRILIPKHLRAYAGIEEDAVFTSSIHGFRVWDPRAWEVIFSEAESALLEDPDLFADVDL